MITIDRAERAHDPSMYLRIYGTVDGVEFCGELSRDSDYEHVSGPEPDCDQLRVVCNHTPMLVLAFELLD